MFRYAHAMHTNWKEAVSAVLAQLEAQKQLEKFAPDASRSQLLGLVYMTEPFAEFSQNIVSTLRQSLSCPDWVGGISPGVCSADEEYYREPALVVMLAQFPASSVRIFSGSKPLPKLDTITASGRPALSSALIHVDPQADQVGELIEDLTIKMPKKEIYGGLMSHLEFNQVANQVIGGGLSGVVFSDQVAIKTSLTLGVQVVGQSHQVTAVRGGMIDTLDHHSAFDVLFSDLSAFSTNYDTSEFNQIVHEYQQRFSNGLFAGVLSKKGNPLTTATNPGVFKFDPKPIVIKPILGTDPVLRSIAIAGHFEVGDELVFCLRDEDSARLDLIRMCAQIREQFDSTEAISSGNSSSAQQTPKIKGGIYIGCRARGAGLFSQPGVELRMVREQLGDVPLIGYFANGEVFQGRVYGYTGVLILFL